MFFVLIRTGGKAQCVCGKKIDVEEMRLLQITHKTVAYCLKCGKDVLGEVKENATNVLAEINKLIELNLNKHKEIQNPTAFEKEVR